MVYTAQCISSVLCPKGAIVLRVLIQCCSLLQGRRVRFINETEANIFFEALMTISQNEVMPTFLFNLFISQEFPIAFFRVIPA